MARGRGGNRNRRPQGQGGGANQGGGGKVKPIDVWRPVPQLPDPETIVPASDPTALLRSLGDPPLPGQGAVAQHYLAAVVERAAGMATALAAAAGLLGQRTVDDD
jgi:hypothetical protein